MTTGMSFYPQAVVLQGRVYIGGGASDNADQNTIVTCYDIERNQWSALPPYTEEFFAMATINEELVLIGGRQRYTHLTSRMIGVWSESKQMWTFGEKIPHTCALLTACDAATAIAHDNRWLVVIGGRDDTYRSLSKVDIIDATKHVSYPGARLPQSAHKLTSAVIGNTLVLLGGADSNNYLNKMFSVKLEDLISQAISSESGSISPWQTLPDTPLLSCTALAFNGALLAIGGYKLDDEYGLTKKHVDDLHLFDFNTRLWVAGGRLLADRLRCACAVLPSGEMFITGGASRLSGRCQKEVHIATLQ